MARIVEIDPREITITPVFKILEVENVPKSEKEGRPMMEMREVVEVRFAGSKNYAPVFPTDAMWRREGNQIITYAERWPDQYRAFKEGNPQEANGTPLEMLRSHGITAEQLSLCRALRIYSVEALHHLEGKAVKSLGMSANALKGAAAAFLGDRLSGQNTLNELDALRAEIAALKAERSTSVPVTEPTPDEVENAIARADAAYADMTDDELKERIAEKTGARPRGQPSRATLVRSLEELEAA